MAQVIFKRGKSHGNMNAIPHVDGQLLFITDEGHIYLDYTEGGEQKRRLFYSGKLTFGDINDPAITFDGTNDVNVPLYKGEVAGDGNPYEGDYDYNS